MPNVVLTKSRNFTTVILNWLRNWSQRASLYPVFLGMKCCAIEMAATMASRYDTERIGILARASPRHCDVLWINGPMTIKAAPRLRTVYDLMAAPKWVFATGECAISGGPFWQAPTILEGTDQVIPVDIYVPGCPPRPEAMWAGLHRLQEKIKADGVYVPEPLRELPREFYERAPPLIDHRIILKGKLLEEEEK
ncbi:NADH-quinone oxidoreductase subunit B [Candidatus Heimdallarchaeota archaeon B3_Heim]|nr:MAG: NADH-quinone oxidoreductase subunit B [Candidatus Heimdallarchaeota archaeon B3_Heim]